MLGVYPVSVAVAVIVPKVAQRANSVSSSLPIVGNGA